MPLREQLLGRLATSMPNRKFAATGFLAAKMELAGRGEEAALMRANAAFVWSYYWRFMRLAFRRSRKRTYDRVASVGEERLRAAAAEGRGVILLSVHLGDFDAAGGWLAEREGITPVVVARRLRPRWREALFCLLRHRCGVLLREAGDTSLDRLALDLKEGRAVLVMLDRRPSGPTSPSRILGRPAVAPLSVGLLAAHTQAPMLPAATWRNPGGALTVWFGEPFTAVEPTRAVAEISETAEQLGSLIRAHPEQWHVPADISELACLPLAAVGAPDGLLGDAAAKDAVPAPS
ncbi:MAG: lysophospholipid acyltransferase family protein [Solirubrobacterales bacterium]